jgi:hypothetical protein
MSGECPDDERIFVHYMFGGTKNSSYGCPELKNTSYPETCCTLQLILLLVLFLKKKKSMNLSIIYKYIPFLDGFSLIIFYSALW